MSVYKINFANRTIVSCTLVNNPIKLSDKYICEQVNGKPIYALIDAENENEAISVANQILMGVSGACESCL